MAVPDQVAIRQPHVVAYLRSIPVSDTDPRPKFVFLGAAILDGRKVGYFLKHPQLWQHIDRYKFYTQTLSDFYRTGDKSRLFLLAPSCG